VKQIEYKIMRVKLEYCLRLRQSIFFICFLHSRSKKAYNMNMININPMKTSKDKIEK